MPLIEKSNFVPKRFVSYSHLQTIYAARVRRIKQTNYLRQRIETPDDDFLDLDWSKIGSNRLVIVMHGLEGNAERPYVRGMINYFNQRNWDGLAFNYRGCSGEINRKLRGYHSGETGDLDFVIQQLEQEAHYQKIAIIGFSLGGNITLKYVGEKGKNLSPLIKAVATYSTPCDLKDSSSRIHQWDNRLYLNSFLKSLKEKAEIKNKMFPGELSIEKIRKANNFNDYDDAYTGPVHGFKDALDYWTQSSCRQFIPTIQVPTLLVNALDDSFLGQRCFPFEEAKENEHFFLETPAKGGHVGFISTTKNDAIWSEWRAFEFIAEYSQN